MVVFTVHTRTQVVLSHISSLDSRAQVNFHSFFSSFHLIMSCDAVLRSRSPLFILSDLDFFFAWQRTRPNRKDKVSPSLLTFISVFIRKQKQFLLLIFFSSSIYTLSNWNWACNTIKIEFVAIREHVWLPLVRTGCACVCECERTVKWWKFLASFMANDRCKLRGQQNQWKLFAIDCAEFMAKSHSKFCTHFF